MIAKAVAEATSAAIQAMGATMAKRLQSMAGPKIGRPVMKQLIGRQMTNTVNFKTFRLEVNNILTISNAPQTEQLAMAKNWVDRKGLQFIESLKMQKKIHAAH